MTLFLAIWFTFGLFTVGLISKPSNWIWELLLSPLWPLSLGHYLQRKLNK